MKTRNIILMLFASLAFMMFTSFSKSEITGTLFIKLSNLKSTTGWVEISLYKSEDKFLKDGGAWETKRVRVDKKGNATIVFSDIPIGTYAAAGYHDKNSNRKLDCNFIGVPQEPYAFSKDYTNKTRKPHFHEVDFRFEQPEDTIVMEFQEY